MKNDEIPDPNRIRVTLSKGEFESLDQAKMYCEKNFDRLCTEKDMIQAYTKQRYRACTFGWYDSPNGYVDIGRGAAGKSDSSQSLPPSNNTHSHMIQ